jgi:hypothetical protein
VLGIVVIVLVLMSLAERMFAIISSIEDEPLLYKTLDFLTLALISAAEGPHPDYNPVAGASLLLTATGIRQGQFGKRKKNC